MGLGDGEGSYQPTRAKSATERTMPVTTHTCHSKAHVCECLSVRAQLRMCSIVPSHPMALGRSRPTTHEHRPPHHMHIHKHTHTHTSGHIRTRARAHTHDTCSRCVTSTSAAVAPETISCRPLQTISLNIVGNISVIVSKLKCSCLESLVLAASRAS